MAEEVIKDAEILDLSKQKESNERNDSESDKDDLSDKGYEYTRLGIYTSEIYKVEIQNIPKYLSHSALKKLLKGKFNLATKKVKIIQNKNGNKYAFATFENEEERLKAIDLLNDFVFKNCKLKVFKVSSKYDNDLNCFL